MDKRLTIESYVTKEIDSSYSIIIYIKNIIDDAVHNKFLQHLKSIPEDDWRVGYVGDHQIRRFQRWYHHDNKIFCDKWLNAFDRWNPIEYEDWLQEFERYIEEQVDKMVGDIITKFNGNPFKFNSVLINKYVNGNHFINAHRDSEVIFGNNPTIVSVSFGATRQFVLRRVHYDPENPSRMPRNVEESAKDIVLDLESGSIVIMAGSCQKYYSHEVIRDPNCLESRYNLTFRYHCC